MAYSVLLPARIPVAVVHQAGPHPGGGPAVLLISLVLTVLVVIGAVSGFHRILGGQPRAGGRRWRGGRYSRRGVLGGRRWLSVVVVGLAAVPLAGAAFAGLRHIRLGGGSWIPLAAAAAVGAVLVLAGARVAADRVLHGRRRGWLALPARVRWRLRPGPGFARTWSLRHSHGLPPARRIARNARPSLSWLRRRLPGSWRQYASFNGWAFSGFIRHRLYSSLESLRLIISAPQEGKSGAAAGAILDASGPVVTTSIRGDLIATTAGLRSWRGLLHIWNPEGTGDYASTIACDLVAGCQDMVTAIRRSDAMVEATSARGLSDESFWRDQAALELAALMHAAALAGGDLRTVYRWVLDEADRPVRILARHPGASPEALSQATQYLAMPARTRSGISTTINATLKFMQHPGVVAAVCPPPGEGFDFTAFVGSTDTLYLVASDKTSPVAPLFAALCAELTWVARQAGGIRRPARPPRGRVLGSARLAGAVNRLVPVPVVSRLDPPLDLVLDEAANICPVPVADWATWAAGSGIRLHVYAQAWAQLAQRWGEQGAATIWQACKTKLIYTSTTEPALGKMIEDACGHVRVRGPDDWRQARFGRPRRRPSYEQVPVLPQSALRQLPTGHAVLLQGNAPPAIVRVEQVWRRADVRGWRRLHGSLVLPAPPQRPVPVPDPALMTSADEAPAGPLPPAGGPAGPPDGGLPADPGQLPVSAMPGAPHWTDQLPEIPRELFTPPSPAQPGGPQPPVRPRRQPSRPAPWRPREDPQERG